MKKISLLVATLILTLGMAVSAQAGTISMTGADLLANPAVSFPTLPPTPLGDSIVFGPEDNFPVVMRWDLFSAGTMTAGSATSSVTVNLSTTRNSTDWDMAFGLWDGTNYSALMPAHDGTRLVDNTGAISDGIHYNDGIITFNPRAVTLGIGESAEFTIEYILANGLTTLNFSGLGLTQSFVDTTFDRTSALSLLVTKQSLSEMVQIDAISVQSDLIDGPVPTPEPSTFILLGAGLLGLCAVGRKKIAKS